MTQSASSMHVLHQQQSQFSHPQQQSYGSYAQTQGHGQLPWGAPFPSLHLWPIQDTFAMKMIHLPEAQRIKIGRQTNIKTVPGERNAYFDSKVLSRTHAEIWEQNGKVFIKDLKSSNGTFINNERLSPEGLESEPFELKSEDMLEFGIDIVSEDNRVIVHHKVSAKVYCVFGQDDAAASARELVHYQGHEGRAMRRPSGQHSGSASGMNSMSQMQPVMSAGGKSNGLSFDHVLGKLQVELQKSKETGAELQHLATSMTDIQDTLGGGLAPSQNGSAADLIPPQFRSASAEAQAALAGPHGQQAAAFISLQDQLTDTQSSLKGHLEKIKQLEHEFKEHETLKDEIVSMREQMEASQREMDLFMSGARNRQLSGAVADEDEDEDEDDSRSTTTLMDNDDAEERVRLRRKADAQATFNDGGYPRPGTPEPGANGDRESTNATTDVTESDPVHTQNAELVARIQTMSTEIAEATQLSRDLQTQHGEAMNAVRTLTQKVGDLEEGIALRVAEEVNKAEKRWESWRIKFEEGWKKERESWDAERERLRGVVREWEEASRRAHEEEEDRELNERLSEDDFMDEDEEGEEDEESSEMVAIGSGWKADGVLDVSSSLPVCSPSRSKTRRRRPSHRTALAVRALKAVADDTGSATPKADLQGLEDSPSQGSGRLPPRDIGVKVGRRGYDGVNARRSGCARNVKTEKESSESGKDSGDTLKESEKGVANSRKDRKRMDRPTQLQQPIPVFTVLVVAAIAGALYYRQKD